VSRALVCDRCGVESADVATRLLEREPIDTTSVALPVVDVQRATDVVVVPERYVSVRACRDSAACDARVASSKEVDRPWA